MNQTINSNFNWMWIKTTPQRRVYCLCEIKACTKTDLESLKYQQEVFLENNKRNLVYYFLFWYLSLQSFCLKGHVICEQEKFSIK